MKWVSILLAALVIGSMVSAGVWDMYLSATGSLVPPVATIISGWFSRVILFGLFVKILTNRVFWGDNRKPE